MSWTESFPVMDDDMLAEFEELATPEERNELEEWFGVARIFNPQDKPQILALSLFWKPSSDKKEPYPQPTREILKNAGSMGLNLRFEPWPHYIQPVLDETPRILQQVDNVAVRVYLAADLEFLVPDLIEAGCEVYLMRHPSIAHAPGVAWRVLALGEENKLVTIVDSDRIGGAVADLERTRTMELAGLAAWRVPVLIDQDQGGAVAYKPIIGCQIGAMGGWPVESLLHAFTWHSRRGSIPTMVEMPGCGPRPINLGYWPEFGFEEWFLGVVMYPRLAAGGLLTFVPANGKSCLLTLDIEYATWANPSSQLVHFPVETCCSPPEPLLEPVSAA
jgi:hypothetical protein